MDKTVCSGAAVSVMEHVELRRNPVSIDPQLEDV